MNTVKIFLRKDHVTKKGTHGIYVRLIINSLKKDISLRIYTEFKNWNSKQGLINKSDPEHIRKNKLIRWFKNKAENIVDQAFFNNEVLTFRDFESKLFNKEYNDDSFLEYVIDGINKQNFSKETLKTYKSQITKLTQFKKNISFSEINKIFLLKYKEFMLTKLKNSPKTS